MAKILIPPAIRGRMKEFPDVDWSRILREAVEQELKRRALLKMLDKMLEKSELTDEDALELGRKLRHAGARERVEKGRVLEKLCTKPAGSAPSKPIVSVFHGNPAFWGGTGAIQLP